MSYKGIDDIINDFDKTQKEKQKQLEEQQKIQE